MDSLSQRSQSRDDEFNETQQKLKKDQSQDKLNGKGKMRVSARSDKNNDHLPTKNPTKDRKDSRSRIDDIEKEASDIIEQDERDKRSEHYESVTYKNGEKEDSKKSFGEDGKVTMAPGLTNSKHNKVHSSDHLKANKRNDISSYDRTVDESSLDGLFQATDPVGESPVQEDIDFSMKSLINMKKKYNMNT